MCGVSVTSALPAVTFCNLRPLTPDLLPLVMSYPLLYAYAHLISFFDGQANV
uniref:Uncharacterized protein n=1 Tax=Anguilla anguilla TaxID=7936 RepID=A0A0E9VNU3_ANGAN